MAANMAFRVAQLQGLAQTEAAPSSPPSLLYESPSNHKSSCECPNEEADAPPEETDASAEGSTWTKRNTEDASSRASSSCTETNADSSQVPTSTSDHPPVPGLSIPAGKITGQRVLRSSSTSKIAGRRRPGYFTPPFTEPEKKCFTPACPASDAPEGQNLSRQRFLNIFEDETSAETGSAADTASLRRSPAHLSTRDMDAATSAAAAEGMAAHLKTRHLPRKYAGRRGSYDPARLRAMYCRPEHCSSEVSMDSYAEYGADAVPANRSRDIERSSKYSPDFTVPVYGVRNSASKSSVDRRELPRLAFLPRCDQLHLNRKKERHLYREDTFSPYSSRTHGRTSVSSPILPGVAGTGLSVPEDPTPTGATSLSAAATPSVASAPASARAGPSSAASHYCGDSFSEDTDDDEGEELVEWKGWRELLLERQRAMERHMDAQKRHITQREKEQVKSANKGRRMEQAARRSRKMNTPGSDGHPSPEADTEDEVTSKEEDPLGITPKPAPAKHRSPEKPAAAASTTRSPPSPQQHFAATPPAAASANAFAAARSSGPPLPTAPPFFGSSFPSAFYPSWPPPFYAAAVAAAAAARRAGEEAGMTGQERIQDLKKALERAETELKEKEEEARSQLEEEKKKHEEEKEELNKQLAQLAQQRLEQQGEAHVRRMLRETLDEREKEVTVATAKHAEAEKQKKVLREEFDIITRVHKDMKGEHQREKDALLAEKASLQAKIEDLEKTIEFSKDQLLVARESLVAARAKQLTATQAHEQDLKTLQEYRLEIETLREDLKYLQILNLSLTEKVQRFSNVPQPHPLPSHASAATAADAVAAAVRGGGHRGSSILVGGGVAAGMPQEHHRCFRPCVEKSGSNSSSARKLVPQAWPTLRELLSPQLQQKLLRDRQNECRGAAACSPPLKEATFTLPSSSEFHDDQPADCSASPTCRPAAARSFSAALVNCFKGGEHREGDIGGVDKFSEAAAYGSPAAGGGAEAAEAAAGKRVQTEERRGVRYGGQQDTSTASVHCLPFASVKGGGSPAAVSANPLDSAGARLRAASPVSLSCRNDATVAAGSPRRSLAATALRFRSVPSSSYAFPPVASQGKLTHTSHLSAGLNNKEEMRLARLCATALAAQAQRERGSSSYAPGGAADMLTFPAVPASSSTSANPSSLGPLSPRRRAAMLQRCSNDASAAETADHRLAMPHYRPQADQRQQSCQASPSAILRTQAAALPAADGPAANLYAHAYVSGKKAGDFDSWCQPFDENNVDGEKQPHVPHTSPVNGAGSAASDSPALHERRLMSDASCRYLETQPIPSSIYVSEAKQQASCTGDEQRFLSVPSVNVAEGLVARPSYLPGNMPPWADPLVRQQEPPSAHTRANNEMRFQFKAAQEKPYASDFAGPEDHPASNFKCRDEKRLLLKVSSEVGDSSPLPAFHPLAEDHVACAPAAVGGAAATDGDVEIYESHDAEATASPSGCRLPIPCSSRIGHASSIGKKSEEDNAGQSTVKSSNSSRIAGHDRLERQNLMRQGGSSFRTNDSTPRNRHISEEHAGGNTSFHSKDKCKRVSSTEGTACSSSSSAVTRQQGKNPRGGVSVPPLALGQISGASRVAADCSRNIRTNNVCSGPNSARTQWLLNRVARISRLQGLQNIQAKLKDLPPALLAASDSARRSLQKQELNEAGGTDTGSSIDSKGSNESRITGDRDKTNSRDSNSSNKNHRSTEQDNAVQQ